MKRYITRDYKKRSDHDELDFDLRNEIIPECNDDDSYVPTVEIYKGLKNGWQGESYPIQIDKLIAELNKIKKSCNYVEVMYHTDHIGYVLNGLNIYQSTPEEIKSHEEKEARHKAKMEQINKLRKELDKLENSL